MRVMDVLKTNATVTIMNWHDGAGLMTTLTLITYRMLWHLIGLFLPLHLRWRARQGKENLSRLRERFGIASIRRPKGVVFWLHGASVGETVSSLVLAETILNQNPEAHVLVTSGTVTSAEMVAQRVTSDRIIHQYHPHDHPRWIERFLDHWSPDAVVMMEGEIWPNMVILSAKRCRPVAMASAQMSRQSYQKWKTYGRWMADAIFPCFTTILAVDLDQSRRFQDLIDDPSKIKIGGSMKAAASALPDQIELREAMVKAADGRQIVLLASSHDQEEDLFIDAITSINHNNAFFAVIAPRHIGRGDSIAQMTRTKGGETGQRSQDNLPHADLNWWIADTMGEMGSLIRAADIIVLGGGFAPLGGHNPMEMASLGKGVISGRHVFKNKSIFELLDSHQGVIFAGNTAELTEAITLLSASPTALEQLNKGASRTADAIKTSADETALTVIRLAHSKSNEARL